VNLNLTNKVAIITGASRGIGRAIAEVLAQEGMRLVLAARSPTLLEEIARACPAGAIPFAADLREEPAPQKLIDLAVQTFGQIDCLVNNAGATKRGDFLQLTEADWQDWVDKGLPFDTMRDGTIVLNETQVDEWKSKSHIKLLEPAPVIQTTATPPLLSVNLKDGTATLNGEIYNLESVHLLLLQALLQMPGNWITYSEMKVRVPQLTSELDRLDKAMKRMPKPFLRLIKRQRGRGCRLLTTNT